MTSSPDVSREHVRFRRDSATGRFFLLDLSSLGTTLNGRHVPKGYDEVDGTKQAEWQRNRAARLGPDRSRRHGLPRIQNHPMMTALLWARLVFLALLGAVVGLSAWAAFRTNEDPDR